jgi:hypothetical protein
MIHRFLRAPKRPMLATVLVFLLTACATGPNEESGAWIVSLAGAGYVPGEPLDAVPAFRIDSFKALDPLRVLVRVGPDRAIVVGLRGDCANLGSAGRLGYTTTGGALTRADKLIMITPQQQNACAIDWLRSTKPPPHTH